MSTQSTDTHGILEVICGPMFSGKSEELIRRLRRAKIAKQKVAVFKHAIDDRYDLAYVTSHNGTKLNAHATDNGAHLLAKVQQEGYAVVGIDEIQFYTDDIVATICTLVNDGVRVVVAGLDLDFRGVPFGPMPTLLAIADSITKLKAICTKCGKDAHYTQRLIDDKPAKYTDPVILVAAQESYDARCRNCYEIDKMFDYYAYKQSEL